MPGHLRSGLGPSSVADRRAYGGAARRPTPPELHASWEPAPDRPDPIALLEEQSYRRGRELAPARYGRMRHSPLAFFCGGARIMASDLARTPTAGLMTQLSGDAQLSNFGLFAVPGGHQVFDFCAFDETLPGPFEYDVKRLAASVTVAARHAGLSAAECRTLTWASVVAYRTSIAQFAGMSMLEIWYSRIAEEELSRSFNPAADTRVVFGYPCKTWIVRGCSAGADVAGLWRAVAQGRTHAEDFPEVDDSFGGPFGHRRNVVAAVRQHIPALTPRRARAHSVLPESFRIVDITRAGTTDGSIDVRAYIVVMQGRDATDLLVLQLKEATTSVLQDHLPAGRYRTAGERVVRGQRAIQMTPDEFLGWTTGVRTNRSYYVRQLWMSKATAAVDTMSAGQLDHFVGLCARTLAHAHAKAGDPIALDAYLGEDDAFSDAVTEFAQRYADQNDRDYAAFADAVGSGRIAVDDVAPTS